MKHSVPILASLAVSICFGVLRAQATDPRAAGTWRVDRGSPPSSWQAVLFVDGPHVIGAVSTSSINVPAEIAGGTITDNLITFRFEAGFRTVTVSGTVRGDQIEFVWQAQDREGFPTPDPRDPIFGTAAPRRFIATRAPDATDAVANAARRARRPPSVSFDQLLHPEQQPQNWLTYSGSLTGRRHSSLTGITPENVRNLKMSWIWQSQFGAGQHEATPLVVDGVMYTVASPNHIVALDAATGQVRWTYSHIPRNFTNGYRTNRGLAIAGGKLFMGTLDARLLAVDAFTGRLIWNVVVADPADPACGGDQCHSISTAPLVVKNRVIVGTSGGEGKVRGTIAAFDTDSGRAIWRFATIPAPGEPGHDTWSGDAWKTGGGPVWNVGTYDPDLNLTYWGIGNPAPFDASIRPGDNLYTESVVALDGDTGALRWHYQFTPHDEADWDATQIPVLADLEWQGRVRRVLLFANRNGLFYVLDRSSGALLLGKPFVEVNWMTGFDDRARPVRSTVKHDMSFPGTGTAPRANADPPIRPGPGELGATNWYPPSYSPSTGLFYVPALEDPSFPRVSAVVAIDPATGDRKWGFRRGSAFFKAGALTTAADLLFTGVLGQGAAGAVLDGQFYALHAQTGELLWETTLPGSVQAGPISYAVDGKQYIAVAAGRNVFAFSLRN